MVTERTRPTTAVTSASTSIAAPPMATPPTLQLQPPPPVMTWQLAHRTTCLASSSLVLSEADRYRGAQREHDDCDQGEHRHVAESCTEAREWRNVAEGGVSGANQDHNQGEQQVQHGCRHLCMVRLVCLEGTQSRTPKPPAPGESCTRIDLVVRPQVDE